MVKTHILVYLCVRCKDTEWNVCVVHVLYTHVHVILQSLYVLHDYHGVSKTCTRDKWFYKETPIIKWLLWPNCKVYGPPKIDAIDEPEHSDSPFYYPDHFVHYRTTLDRASLQKWTPAPALFLYTCTHLICDMAWCWDMNYVGSNYGCKYPKDKQSCMLKHYL